MKPKVKFSESGGNTVYVRPVAADDLPEELRHQALGAETLYAVHRSNGAPVALVANRRMAFELARENDLVPVNVH